MPLIECAISEHHFLDDLGIRSMISTFIASYLTQNDTRRKIPITYPIKKSIICEVMSNIIM